ncbi:MAG: hypothetical protein IT381_23490 [Deltaproteobacteria bacterium]|nr:hypothetical protein [Deltaproteobacteria bacterium]
MAFTFIAAKKGKAKPAKEAPAVAAPTPAASAPPSAGGKAPAATGGKTPRMPCPLDSGKPVKVYGHTLNPNAVLEKDEVWTPDNVYSIHGPIHIKKSLTIQAGTVICMTYADFPTEGSANPPPGNIEFMEKAWVKMLGKPDKHIVFTSQNGKNEYWGGMYFASGALNDQSTLQYVDVYNAGGSGSGHPLSTFPDFKAPPLDLQHVTYYSSQRLGLQNLTSGFTPETRIVYNNYTDDQAKRYWYDGYPTLRIHPYAAHTVTEETFKVGEIPPAARYIQLDHAEGMNIDQNVTLHKLQKGLVWRNIQNMKVNGYPDEPPTLKIDPGTVIALSNGGSLRICDGGNSFANIEAVGTKEEPIVFTSDAFVRGEDPQPGDWPSIVFVPGCFCPGAQDCAKKKRLGMSRFDHVIFEYGGGTGKDTVYNCNDKGNGIAAIVFFRGIGWDYEGPPITNSTFRFIAGSGIRNNTGGGNLLTSYTDPKLGNTFEGFDPNASPPRWPQVPLSCPAN